MSIRELLTTMNEQGYKRCSKEIGFDGHIWSISFRRDCQIRQFIKHKNNTFTEV